MEQKQNKLTNPSKKKNQKIDWNLLWSNAKKTFESNGMDRYKAILENFKNQKEEICRVLSIVSEADLARIRRQVEQSSTKGK
jgi:hypothetical protein